MIPTKFFGSLRLVSPVLVMALVWVAFYQTAGQMILPEEAVLVLVAMISVETIVLFIAYKFAQNKDKTSVLLVCLTGFFFCYQNVRYALFVLSWLPSLMNKGLPDNPFPTQIAQTNWQSIQNHVSPFIEFPVYIALVLLITFLVTKDRWQFGKREFVIDFAKVNANLAVILGLLLVMNGGLLLSTLCQREARAKVVMKDFLKLSDKIELTNSTEKPDIYFIIMDGFANEATIKDWGVDDSSVSDGLKKLGFYVVTKSASNYDRTYLSVPAVLSMQYLDEVPMTEKKAGFEDFYTYTRVMENSVIVRVLKQLQYKLVVLSSTPMNYIATADSNVNVQPYDYFAASVIFITPLYAFECLTPIVSYFEASTKNSVNAALNKVFDIHGPKFVLMHTQLPHPMILFDKDGHVVPPPERFYNDYWGTPYTYFQQWKYSESCLFDWLKRILDRPGPKPIIIIQSDHGPFINKATHTEAEWFNHHMRILEAFYFPGQQNKGLYDSISPVNGFRVMLNDYFNARLPILRDRAICGPTATDYVHGREVQNLLHFDK